MKWDITVITNKLKELQDRASKISNPHDRFILDKDIRELKIMLNFALERKEYQYKKDGFRILDIDDFNNMVFFLQKECPKLAYGLCFLNGHKIAPRFTWPKHISEEKFDELIIQFLSSFDPNLLALYLYCKENNRINLSNRCFERSTCKGVCFPLTTTGDIYIYNIFNNKLENAAVMCHELAHGYQYQNVTDPVITQKMLSSVFGEAFPMFVEMCFLYSLRDTKYRKQALKEEAGMIDNLFLHLEYKMDILYHVEDAKFSPSMHLLYNGFGSMGTYLELILSKILALYWKSLYINDPKKALEEVTHFNDNFGIESVKSIYNRYGTDKLIQGVINCMEDYYTRALKK